MKNSEKKNSDSIGWLNSMALWKVCIHIWTVEKYLQPFNVGVASACSEPLIVVRGKRCQLEAHDDDDRNIKLKAIVIMECRELICTANLLEGKSLSYWLLSDVFRQTLQIQ